MKDFIKTCNIKEIDINKFTINSINSENNINKTKNIISTVLNNYKSQFDLSLENDSKKDHTFYNRAKSALKNLNNILKIRKRIPQKLFNDINNCIAYIISKDPNLEYFFTSINLSTEVKKFDYLKGLKNKDYHWKDIVTQVLIYKNFKDSFLNYYNMDDKSHSSEKYLFVFGSLLAFSVVGIVASSSFFQYNMFLNSCSIGLNAIIFIFSLYHIFAKPEFMSMREQMKLFIYDSNDENFTQNILSRDQISI